MSYGLDLIFQYQSMDGAPVRGCASGSLRNFRKGKKYVLGAQAIADSNATG